MRMKRYRLALLGLLFVIPLLAALVATPMALAQATDTPTPTPSASSFLTDIVACWTMDESSGTRVDAYGDNDLTDVNTVGSVAGKYGNAAFFDYANNEYLQRTNDADLETSGEGFTLAGWVKIVAAPVYQFILGDNNYGNITMALYSGNLRWWSPNVGLAASLDAWHYFIFWYDPTLVAGISVDGSEMSDSTTAKSFSNKISMGYDSGYNANGYLDEVAFWHRTLTEDERQVLYNNGYGRDCDYILQPEPTPTPTPSGQMIVPLSSGDWLTVNRQIDYGQIATVATILGLLLVGIVYAIIRFGRQWL